MQFGKGAFRKMSVKSAERVLRIFELLAENPDGLTIKEVSEALSIPQSSTSGLVDTLFQEGYLIGDYLKKYKLGPRLIQLGRAAVDTLDISDQGTPYLKKLMEDVQETVFMAVLSDNKLVYVAKIDNNRSIRTTAQPGQKKPLYCTGLGKAFLSFLPERVSKDILEDLDLVRITPNTITDMDTLKKQLSQYKEMGYSIDDEENEEGLFCLAAPVFGADDTVQAAISVAGPKERMVKRKEYIVGKLLKTSEEIARSIGHQHR
jgi:DNA-binding IclR family transcriptional regulator